MLKTGERLGNFEIVQPLAAGGMGVVYLGRHHMLKTPAAIKVLLPNLAMKESVRKRFAQEAYVQSQLNHPGIVKVIDFIHEGQLMAFVMEFVEGPTLHHLIEEEHPEIWQVNEALTVLRGPLLAVAYAHRREVVHRDLKPANIILERTEETGWPGHGKVTDFGLVKVLADESGMTATGTRMGTIPYMAPEQFTAEETIDARADVYALGMILHRMLSGALPYPADDLVQAANVYTGQQPIPPIQGLPTNIAEALSRATAVNPAARPADAGEFGAMLGLSTNLSDSSVFLRSTLRPPDDLGQAKTEDLAPPQPTAPPETPSADPPSRKVLSLGLIAAGIAILVGAAFMTSGDDTPTEASKAHKATKAVKTKPEAMEKVRQAWQRLDQYKLNKSEHKADSLLPVRALEDAREAVRIDNTPTTRSALAMSTVAASRWGLKDTDWDSVTFDHDRAVVNRTLADKTAVAKVANAILLAHGCGISKHRTCIGVQSALRAAQAVVPAKPTWLAGDLAWAQIRYWSTKAVQHIQRDEDSLESAAWREVLSICQSHSIDQLTQHAVGPLIKNECVYAAARNEMTTEWVNWMRWFLDRDQQEYGKFLPWVIRFSMRSSTSRCRRMKTKWDRNARNRLVIVDDADQALCATYGLVALGCLSQADSVMRSWRLQYYSASEMRALSRASQANAPSQSCYLDGAVQGTYQFSP